MIEKDYIMKILNQFFDSLSKFLAKAKQNTIEDFALQLNAFYKDYLKEDRWFFLENKLDDIFSEFNKASKQEYIAKLEILSELLLIEIGLAHSAEAKFDILNKELNVLIEIKEQTKSFSIERENKIQSLRQQIEEIQS
jgi:hypothetical protein